MTKAEIALGRFGLKPSNVAEFKPPWQLSTSDVKIANQRLKNIHVPAHLDFKPQCLFSHPTRLNSHDWKQVYAAIPLNEIHATVIILHIDCMHWCFQVLFAGHVGEETKRLILLLFGHSNISSCRITPDFITWCSQRASKQCNSIDGKRFPNIYPRNVLLVLMH